MIRNIILFIFLFSALILKGQTPEQLKSWLPTVEGWTVKEDIEIFDPENLFDRINGAAPLFIENNFREMTSLEYTKGKDYITIQAYRHATPEDAFGMYSSERSSELDFFDIGGEAQGDKVSLFFFAGNMYMKMWATTSEEGAESVLHQIGKGLAGKIDPNAAAPALFAVFPAEGKIPYTDAYITANYIGHEFLKNVYLSKYERGGKSFQLFVLDGKTTGQMKEILEKYYTFTRQALDVKEGSLVIKDRYNGDIPAIWKGQYLIGIFSENGENIEATDLLKEMADKI